MPYGPVSGGVRGEAHANMKTVHPTRRANVAAYAGETVKLRLRRRTGEVWVDGAGAVTP